MPTSVLKPLKRTLLSGYVGQGPRVLEFEKALASWVQNPRVLAVNSGTSAIQLALRLAGVRPGDDVITTPMTCVATNMPIVASGANIIWADIDPRTGNVDPSDVERKITRRVKAIVFMHWGGYPCELEELNKMGKRYGLRIIEDAAHAFGAIYRGRAIGSWSDYVCFSFQAIKQLTTADGGAIVCRNQKDYERGKLLRWFGLNREVPDEDFRCGQNILEYGYKFHMNDVNATIGLEQLKYVKGTLARYRQNAAYYWERFRILRALQCLDYREDRLSSYWLFTVRVKDRTNFVRQMSRAGITVSRVHERNDHYSVFKAFRRSLPGVDEFSREQVSIPVGWWLTDRNRAYIADTVERVCQ